MPYFVADDIVQISSPPGRALTGMVRVSGPAALSTAGRVLAEPEDLAALGRGVFDRLLSLFLTVRDRSGDRAGEHRVCPARLFLMPAPASYTREDVVEVHVPGSPALLASVMTAFVAAGARPAAPGEFTFRAFRNGRLTLSQAEAVEETIHAAAAAEAKTALARLGDPSPGRVGAWRDRLADIAAGLEATLDFAGEGSENDPAAELADLIRELTRSGAAISGAEIPALLPHVALVGLTNAGKSSLLNALVGEDGALVSPEASTTRDHLRREVEWDGLRLVVSDNPGHDPGARGGAGAAAGRALERLGGEDAACWVVDAARPLDAETSAYASRLSGKVVVALNKSDLPSVAAGGDIVAAATRGGFEPLAILRISAAAGTGMAELRSALAAAARGAPSRPAWNRREGVELEAALLHCRRALAELEGPGRIELAAEEARSALAAFSRALGEGYAEETLGRIFAHFCLGK